jgi:CMP-N-acetylneuraminic acid synthetase/spore coat polysaccharide biosynthesis predicted glycosyltransferase SpsG
MSDSPHAAHPQGLLAIIPARSGSKEVRRKNIRRIGGLPLFAHTVRALEESGVAERLIISTDDPVVIAWAEQQGVEISLRPEALRSDATTIAEVAASLADELSWEGVVGVFQPTSPLRSAASIRRALEELESTGAGSLMSVEREPHLLWAVDAEGPPRPLFAERVNRQFSSQKIMRETGAIQLVDASWLRDERSMVSERHHLFELPEEECHDIDTIDDLVAARRRAERGRVIFRITANREVGGGHLYHCLELAEELDDQEIAFLLKRCDPFVSATLAERGFEASEETSLREDLATLKGTGPCVLINDILDTSEDDVLIGRALGMRVVNIEDLGPGARYADWVVNALYPAPPDARPHTVSGVRWASLRPEFRYQGTSAVRAEAYRVLVTFGSTDPSSMTTRVAEVLAAGPSIESTVVLGAGANDAPYPPSTTVKRQVENMAKEMASADVIVTAAGRSVYEAASLGVPVVVIAQNAREATHCHLGFESGVIFLGIGPLVADHDILEVVQRLLRDPALRSELSARLSASIDGRGSERIADGIRRLLRGLDP